MSNKSSLVPFLTGDEDQNLHVKIVKNSGKPGLNCTENTPECSYKCTIMIYEPVKYLHGLIQKRSAEMGTSLLLRNQHGYIQQLWGNSYT